MVKFLFFISFCFYLTFHPFSDFNEIEIEKEIKSIENNLEVIDKRFDLLENYFIDDCLVKSEKWSLKINRWLNQERIEKRRKKKSIVNWKEKFYKTDRFSSNKDFIRFKDTKFEKCSQWFRYFGTNWYLYSLVQFDLL